MDEETFKKKFEEDKKDVEGMMEYRHSFSKCHGSYQLSKRFCVDVKQTFYDYGKLRGLQLSLCEYPKTQ